MNDYEKTATLLKKAADNAERDITEAIAKMRDCSEVLLEASKTSYPACEKCNKPLPPQSLVLLSRKLQAPSVAQILLLVLWTESIAAALEEDAMYTAALVWLSGIAHAFSKWSEDRVRNGT